MTAALLLLRRELALSWNGGGGPLLACGFLLSLAVIVPLGAGPQFDKLAGLAPGLVWLALSLASLLTLERLFERDFEDGTLDLLALGSLADEVVVGVKVLSHWLAIGLPLALMTLPVGISLGLAPARLPLLAVTAALGALAFSFTGGLGAALAIGARKGGLLIAVIVLPLFLPPVIFGAGALVAQADGRSPAPALALLIACTLVAAVIGVLAGAAGLRGSRT